MSQIIDDGNIIGRLGAIALLAALGFGFHKLNCGEGMCPMRTDCCHHAEAQAEASPASPAAAAPAPAAAK